MTFADKLREVLNNSIIIHRETKIGDLQIMREAATRYLKLVDGLPEPKADDNPTTWAQGERFGHNALLAKVKKLMGEASKDNGGGG